MTTGRQSEPTSSAGSRSIDADGRRDHDVTELSPRISVRRHPERGIYDRGAIDAILDEALICHVGFAIDRQPFVIPTIHARVVDTLYLHGSPASRMLRQLVGGVDVCVTATIVDGVVLVRSVHSR
jgi:nitroimidazol reductase NimA-like FMN-containing flavoprotein (pyridoxamine 5'-phosphate oxidase superfamily)